MPRAKRTEIPEEFLQPPSGTSARAREIWLEVVQSFEPRFFTGAQRMRLYSYCEASAMVEKLRKRLIRMTDPDGIRGISATIRIHEMTALQEARALRLTNQSHRPPPLRPGEAALAGNPVASTDGDLEDLWTSLPFPERDRPN